LMAVIASHFPGRLRFNTREIGMSVSLCVRPKIFFLRQDLIRRQIGKDRWISFDRLFIARFIYRFLSKILYTECHTKIAFQVKT
jgi:hypothetical protein